MRGRGMLGLLSTFLASWAALSGRFGFIFFFGAMPYAGVAAPFGFFW